MGLNDTLKRLLRLVHDPVDYADGAEPSSEVRRAVARNESDTYGRQSGLG